MAAPVWITDPGSLGTVPEGKFYRISLEAFDPDDLGPGAVTYSLIAGELPSGVQVSTTGIIEGIPVSVADFKGVPTEVAVNTTSKFAIRVIDAEERIADRTFTLTVSGQDKPEWITPSGLVGQWFDGGEVSFQFLAGDPDPGDTLEISLVSGDLPLGLTLGTDGLLSGFAEPLIDLEVSADPGWDRDETLFDEFPFDFSTTSISQNYQFTLQVTDGKDVVLRTFSVFIYSRNGMTADNIEFTADNGTITADSIAIRSPYITNNVDDLGTFRHDNYFAHKFEGEDPNGDQIEYSHESGSFPPGVTLDTTTGWISGYLPDIGLTEIEYNFGIKTYKTLDNDIRSLLYETSMSLIGDIETSVVWLTDSDLGTIDNGSISTFSIAAEHIDTALNYRLKAGGLNSKLPQGLKLLTSGNIVGRVSFKMFSLDGGTTTFDSEHATRLEIDPTTLDSTYTFTVEAYSANGIVSVTKEFTILVNAEYNGPHNTVYCKALPPLADRELLDTLLLNQIIDPALLYRADDPNFGSANRVIYNHAFGLLPASTEAYFAALESNHYNRNVVLGELKTARALDDNDNVIYEVVYSQVIDNLVNPIGESIPPEVFIKYPAIDDGSPTTTVYPNSLENMRGVVIDQVGQQSKVLPRWMLSKQENGEVLGFTPAWVIAYTKPSKSKLLQYNIREFFGTQLNLIDFEIDRYILDAKLSQYWGITADSGNITADDDMLVSDSDIWKRSIMTTFDRDDGIELETVFDGGSCRFTSPVDVYDSSDTNNQYIKFPKTLIINNKQ